MKNLMLRWCYEGDGFFVQVLKDGDNKGGFYWRYAAKGDGKKPPVWVQSQVPSKTLGECIDEVMSMTGLDELDSSMTSWASRSGIDLPKLDTPQFVFSPHVPKPPEKCDLPGSRQK
jgi:hypothetical protein